MKKMLFWGDSPLAQSGFGRVASHVLKSLVDTGEYDISVVAINHDLLYYDQKVYPYRIYPANFYDQTDLLGKQLMAKMIMEGEWDYIFCLNDPDVLYGLKNVIAEYKKTHANTKVVFYMPIDNVISVPVHNQAISICDKAILYTEFAKKLVLDSYPELEPKIDIIYHGTDIDTFHVVSDKMRNEFRKKAFNIEDDTFLVLNVNRNQWRKDMFRTLTSFLLFWKDHPDAKLYMHCKLNDAGGDLLQQLYGICEWLDIDFKEIANGVVSFPPADFNVLSGVPIETLNMIYNSADVMLSSTLGEGWGLTTTEALATKLPVIMPRNTSMPEILGDNQERGYLVPCGETIENWLMPYGFSATPRPTTSIQGMVDALNHVYNNREEAKRKAHYGRKWCKENTWEIIGKKWVELFKKI